MIRARYTPGLAFFAVAGDRAVLLPPTTSGETLDRVWSALHDEPDALHAELSSVAEYAFFDGDAARLRVAIRGALVVEATGEGIDPQTLSGSGPEETIAVVERAERATAVLGWAMPNPALPLLGGVVRAASVELMLAATDSAPVDDERHDAEIPHETILPVDADGDGIYDEHEAVGMVAPDDEAADADEAAQEGTPHTDPDLHLEPGAPAPIDPGVALSLAAIPTEPIVKAPAPGTDPVAPVVTPPTVPFSVTELGDHDGNTMLPGDLQAIRNDQDGDHDGRTVSAAELAATRGAHPVTAPTEAIPTAAPAAPAAPERPVPRLRVSTGAEVRLDRPVLIGRRPRSVRSVGEDVPHLITVESPQHDISRNHVEIKIEDDVAMVTDLNSTNGTLLYHDGDPQRLHPGERTIVMQGDTLDLGEGIVVSFVGLP